MVYYGTQSCEKSTIFHFNAILEPIKVRAANFDKNPTVLISDNMHLNKADQRNRVGKAIQEIYGPFISKPYEVIKVHLLT